MSEAEYTLCMHCGITFAGIKAASLFRIKQSCCECMGKYERHFNARGFAFVPLKEEEDSLLLYVYNRRQLESILFDGDNKAFLEGEGYVYDTVGQALACLKRRMASDGFPHEIGTFLGYPLSDVKGFISHPNDGVKLVGYWKVYGDEERKRRLFDTYTKCTRRIRDKLVSGIPLETIFR